MIDNYAATYADIVSLADTATPPAIVEPVKPTWLGNDVELREEIEKSIKNPDYFKRANRFTYVEKGPLGIPSLKWDWPVEYIARTTDANKIETLSDLLPLSSLSCYMLDVEAQKPGAWGPECKISKFIKRPRGKLRPRTPADGPLDGYMYTPPGNGKRATTDTIRFILENGEGKKVDVTVKLTIGLDDAARASLTPEIQMASNGWTFEPQDLSEPPLTAEATAWSQPYGDPVAWNTVINAAVRQVSTTLADLPGTAAHWRVSGNTAWNTNASAAFDVIGGS
jgi:hypothetical protein